MPVTFRGSEAYQVMPWRNGLGVTVELAREDGPGEAGFLWRLSRADVAQDGAFSNFPGIDRTLLLLNGAGLTLAFGDRAVVLDKRYQMARFAGDEATQCALLHGPCKDFNIMVDRARGRAAVTLSEAAFSSHAAPRTLLHVLEGEWALDFDGAGTRMPADSLAVLTGELGKAYAVRGSGVLLRVDIDVL